MKKLLLLFAVFAICSCSGKFDEDAVRETTNQFFTNLQNQNWTMVNQIYPEFSKITSYHNFINYAIEDMVYEKGKGICVNIDLEYLTNRLSPPSHYKMKLFFDRNKETKTYYIKDSQSFAMFERDGYLYQYAIKTGCLNEITDVMDIAISEKIIAANEMYNYNFEKVKEAAQDATKITKVTEKGWGYGDNEWRIVKWKIENNYSYTLTNLVCNYKSLLMTGASKSFSDKVKSIKAGEYKIIDGGLETTGFHPSYTLVFDDAVHNILQNEIAYQGDEYEKYLLEIQNTSNEVE